MMEPKIRPPAPRPWRMACSGTISRITGSGEVSSSAAVEVEVDGGGDVILNG